MVEHAIDGTESPVKVGSKEEKKIVKEKAKEKLDKRRKLFKENEEDR